MHFFRFSGRNAEECHRKMDTAMPLKSMIRLNSPLGNVSFLDKSLSQFHPSGEEVSTGRNQETEQKSCLTGFNDTTVRFGPRQLQHLPWDSICVFSGLCSAFLRERQNKAILFILSNYGESSSCQADKGFHVIQRLVEPFCGHNNGDG
jgi:hypothetical protein